MAKLLKLRRGTTTQHGSFTGAEGELTIDTTKDTAVVHDGSTAGGRALLREDASNLPDQSIQLNHLPHGTSSNNGKFLRANNGADPTFETVDTSLVADTSPQLGGNLDLNSNDISGTGNISISGNLSGNALTTNAGNVIINSTAPTVSFVDSNANPDYEIKVDGGTFDIRDSTNNSSKFNISLGEVHSQGKFNCEAGLDTNGDVKLNTGSTNVNVLFDASASNMRFSDSMALSFGDHSTTGDYNISYVNGSDFNIVGQNGGSGDLVLGTYANASVTKNLVSKRSNNAVELYFGGNKKAETVTGGFTVTGTCTATAFAGDGSALTGIDAFPSGTKMLFQQTAAPTGWTKITSGVENKGLRVTSGTAGSGGTNAFSNTFTNKSITANAANATQGGNITVSDTSAGGNVSIDSATTGGTVDSHTLTTNQMPSHVHYMYSNQYHTQSNRYANSAGFTPGYNGQQSRENAGNNRRQTYNSGYGESVGGDGGHSHGFTGGSHNHNGSLSGTAHNHNASFTGSAHNHSITVNNLDLAVQYLDVIIAQKD